MSISWYSCRGSQYEHTCSVSGEDRLCWIWTWRTGRSTEVAGWRNRSGEESNATWQHHDGCVWESVERLLQPGNASHSYVLWCHGVVLHEPASWRSGQVIANGAVGLRFKPRTNQIGYSVADRSPPIRSDFYAEQRWPGVRRLARHSPQRV